MSAVDIVVDSFAEMPDDLHVLTDGDDCLFRYGTTELFPDAKAYLDVNGDNIVGMVSAHYDRELTQARQSILGVDICPLSGVIPHLNKYSLYAEAARLLAEGRGSYRRIAVVDDRWFNGVVAGKHALRQVGIEAIGVLLRRPNTTPNNIIDQALARIETIGAVAANHLGIDRFIRPVL